MDDAVQIIDRLFFNEARINKDSTWELIIYSIYNNQTGSVISGMFWYSLELYVFKKEVQHLALTLAKSAD